MSIGKNSINRAEKAALKDDNNENSALFSVPSAISGPQPVGISEKSISEPSSPLASELAYIPVSEIFSSYSENNIICGAVWKDLLDSAEKYGIIEPLVLRKVKDGYRIISGHKRLFAAKRLNISKLPARVIEADDNLAAALSSELSSFASDALYYTKERTAVNSSEKELPDYLL